MKEINSILCCCMTGMGSSFLVAMNVKKVMESLGMEDVLVTIEAPCSVSEESITVGGGYELRVGVMAYLRGNGYMGSGPIVAIEQGVQG